MEILIRNNYPLLIHYVKCYIQDSQFLQKCAIPNRLIIAGKKGAFRLSSQAVNK
jgi:hypothetical protein